MGLILNVFFVGLAVICLGVVVWMVIPILRSAFSPSASANESETIKRITRIVQEFIPAGANDNPGRSVTALMVIGYFTSLRMGNSGKDVDDGIHLKNFRKNNTPGMYAASKGLTDYDRYNI
jgi:hypothetical protein